MSTFWQGGRALGSFERAEAASSATIRVHSTSGFRGFSITMSAPQHAARVMFTREVSAVMIANGVR